VPHLINEFELAIPKLPEEKQKLQTFGLNRNVLRESERLKGGDAMGLCPFGIDLQIVRNAVFSQERIESYTLDFDLTAFHSSPAGSCWVERTENISFLIHPEQNFSWRGADADLFQDELSPCNFRRKSLAGTLREDWVWLYRNDSTATPKIVGGVISVIHSDVKNMAGFGSGIPDASFRGSNTHVSGVGKRLALHRHLCHVESYLRRRVQITSGSELRRRQNGSFRIK
jgi:hypothetical protein